MHNLNQKLFITILISVSAINIFGQINVAKIDKQWVIPAAEKYLKEKPITITAFTSSRSAGGKHDFFSEGDYW